ncbi:MAG: rod shape-determining protein MreD [Prochlorothrix sp.]|nr:rod shape-determining protein MreD [Prochlorothrix sp.]
MNDRFPGKVNWQSLPPIALDAGAIALSVLLCVLLALSRLPGTELAGVSTNWLLIWVVSWSIKRSPLEGALVGCCLGWIQDGLTAPYPTHALGLALAGILTALLQKNRYLQEDFISVALIVFGMAVLVETTMAIEISLQIQVQDWLPTWIDTTPSQDPGFNTSLLTVEGVDPSYVDRVGLTLGEIWRHHQRIALSSAIVSSLWAPIAYYPLNRWWDWLDEIKGW